MQLQEILNSFRESSRSEREKGDYFERLIKIFLENDDIQKQFYSKVVPFAEWAKNQGWNKIDTGIDLVATLSDGSGYSNQTVSSKHQATISLEKYGLFTSARQPDHHQSI